MNLLINIFKMNLFRIGLVFLSTINLTVFFQNYAPAQGQGNSVRIFFSGPGEDLCGNASQSMFHAIIIICKRTRETTYS